jgi:hypothetical protein
MNLNTSYVAVSESRNLYSFLRHNINKKFCENSFSVRVYLSPDTYTMVLLQLSPGGTRLSTWTMEWVVPWGATIRGPYTLPGAPAEVRLGAASIEAAGADAGSVILAVGLSVPHGLFGVTG